MKHKVYKVVTYSKDAVNKYYATMHPPTIDDASLVFRSSNMVGEAALFYQIGVETKSDTPIFTFAGWSDAIEYAAGFSPILVGESTSAPYFLRNRVDSILAVTWLGDLTIEEVRTFWNTGSIPATKRQEHIPGFFPSKTIVVHDFTPTAILYRGSLECVYGEL